MDIYYSQYGEDFLMNRIFNNETNGFYVEVGCLDGVEFSNTYYFEKKGWRGACIEAHQDFISPLRKNRPNASVVHYAVGEKDMDNVTFYANKIGSLSTLNKGEEERWKKDYKDYFYGFEEQKVSMRTLTTIFDELKIATINFVSLDIEGYEVQALLGLDFAKYKPIVFIIEYKDEAHQNEIDNILLPQGYFFLSKIGCNLFYSLDLNHKKIVTARYGEVRLLQIDIDGKEIWRNADQLNPTNVRRIKSFLKRTLATRVWSYFKKKKSSRTIYPVFNKGFHGDDFLIDVANAALRTCKNFIETGSAEATTLSFVANAHPTINCYSCEADEKVYAHAKKQVEQFSNVVLKNTSSPDFIISLTKENPQLLREKTCFWLDAHGYGFKWPLREEVKHILKNYSQAYIFIDDFKVPNQPQFGYDTYEDQECSLDYLSDVLEEQINLKIYFPKYKTITSEYHPLRGWVLIENTSEELIANHNSEDIFLYTR